MSKDIKAVIIYYKSAILWLLLMLCICSVKGQKQHVFPAEKNNLWGFINEKGKWVEKPHYASWFDKDIHHEIYFMIEKDSLFYNLIVIDKFGTQLQIVNDAFEYYYDGHFELKNREFSLNHLENEILFGKEYSDSVQFRNYRLDYPDRSRYSVYKALTNDPDSIVPVNDEYHETFKLWYKLHGLKNIGSIQPVSYKLTLINEGGYTLATYSPPFEYRTLDQYIFRTANYELKEVRGGKWGMVDNKGNYIIRPTVINKKFIACYYPDYHPSNFEQKDTYLSFVLFQDEIPGINDPIHLFNNNGLEIYKEENADSYIVNEFPGFYTVRFMRDNEVYHAVSINYRGMILDTFQNINCSNKCRLCAVKKNGNWGIMDFNQKMIAPYELKSNQNMFPLNSVTAWYSLNDTTIRIVNLQNKKEISTYGGSIDDSKNGYSITKKDYKNGKYKFTLIDSTGRILYASSRFLRFKDTLYFTRNIGFEGIYEPVLRYKDLLRYPQKTEKNFDDIYPIPNALKVGDCFVSEYSGFILDTTFHLMRLADEFVIQSENNFFITENINHSLYYKMYFKGRFVSEFPYSYPKLFHSASPYFTVIYGHNYIIHLPLKNKFISTNAYTYITDPPQVYDELIRVKYITDNEEKFYWVYFNSNGKMIYKSNPHSKPKFERFKWRFFKIKMKRLSRK